MTVPETEKHRPKKRNRAIKEVCRVEVQEWGQCGFWRAVHCGWWCCHQLVLKEKSGWMGESDGGWTSVNQSVNKQIASLLNSGWASRGSRPAEGAGGMGGQGPGAACCWLLAACAHAECSDAPHAGRQESRWWHVRAGQLNRGA